MSRPRPTFRVPPQVDLSRPPTSFYQPPPPAISARSPPCPRCAECEDCGVVCEACGRANERLTFDLGKTNERNLFLNLDFAGIEQKLRSEFKRDIDDNKELRRVNGELVERNSQLSTALTQAKAQIAFLESKFPRDVLYRFYNAL